MLRILPYRIGKKEFQLSESTTVLGESGNANSSVLPNDNGNQKKKNNRNKKNKQKVKDISFLPALQTAILKDAGLSTSSVENKPREDIELDQGSLQSSSLYKDPNQYSEQKYSEIEESHGKMNNLLKSQHSRRMPRNMQANRIIEKSHGSDALMWAPVKPPNKGILDESSEKSKIKAIVPAKIDQQVHNLRNKRAERERYIPKPVAKEMAQQESSQQMVSSISQAPVLRLGAQGREIDEHGNVVNITKPSNLSTLKDGYRQNEAPATPASALATPVNATLQNVAPASQIQTPTHQPSQIDDAPPQYNSMIFEALSTIRDAIGSDLSAIVSFIEQKHNIPQNHPCASMKQSQTWQTKTKL
ncbi:hypothetical protein KIW84_057327 [Lathyrus oleraceus]|uniref:H15 domain-containing protein n=1 Tax=Pisum sativum TaxID=3888 RepID=A0A9D4X1X3_PEA|nr:hypothetical protein KIW84_057327 [Pisum sativum]